MLVLNNKLIGTDVASVQASHKVGQVSGYLIDPRRLEVMALYVKTRLNPAPLILHTVDIRDFSSQGAIIDHNEQLMEPDGLVRLKEVVDIDFQLIDKPVLTEDGRRLGKVNGFAFDTLGWKIMRINVRQTVTKSLSTTELIIHRQQIVKVSDTEIVVKSATVKTSRGWSLKKLLFGTAKPALNPDSSSITDE
ncbi:MAG TPA: hypothetical protein VGA08_03045 [Candidatus Saccharimonadales bacterium]